MKNYLKPRPRYLKIPYTVYRIYYLKLSNVIYLAINILYSWACFSHKRPNKKPQFKNSPIFLKEYQTSVAARHPELVQTFHGEIEYGKYPPGKLSHFPPKREKGKSSTQK